MTNIELPAQLLQTVVDIAYTIGRNLRVKTIGDDSPTDLTNITVEISNDDDTSKRDVQVDMKIGSIVLFSGTFPNIIAP